MGFIVTLTLVEFIHPVAVVVPVTVYVWVAVSVAVTVAPVVEERPVDGLQAYVFAPLAVRAVGVPEHTVVGLTFMVGRGLTVTVAVPVWSWEQPLLSVIPIKV
jgi:hypothetical protein